MLAGLQYIKMHTMETYMRN